MPRPTNTIPTVNLTVRLPQDIHARLALHLHSDLEGRIPFAAYQKFLTERIKEFFESDRLDLAPFAGTTPDAFVVRGSPEAVAVLRKALKGEVPV